MIKRLFLTKLTSTRISHIAFKITKRVAGSSVLYVSISVLQDETIGEKSSLRNYRERFNTACLVAELTHGMQLLADHLLQPAV